MKKKSDRSKDSIVDGLRGVEEIGGRKPIEQLMCCKASVLLNEEIIEPLELTTHKFPNIKMNKKQREDIVKKWEELGFLDGLSGHVKENITDLYCCKASSMLNDIKKG